MNYKKVIKDLKERSDKLQEQYRLRDIRCIHLEYENEMLKSDFKAQHELTKKYAEENKQLKEVIDKAINNSQYWIDYYTRLNSDERIALRLQENIDILKEVE